MLKLRVFLIIFSDKYFFVAVEVAMILQKPRTNTLVFFAFFLEKNLPERREFEQWTVNI